MGLELLLRQARVIFRGQNSYSDPYRLQQRAWKRYMIVAATSTCHPTSTEGITWHQITWHNELTICQILNCYTTKSIMCCTKSANTHLHVYLFLAIFWHYIYVNSLSHFEASIIHVQLLANSRTKVDFSSLHFDQEWRPKCSVIWSASPLLFNVYGLTYPDHFY